MPGSPPCRGASATGTSLFKQALDYIVAIGGSAIHCMAGKVPPEQRPAAETTFIANLDARRRSGRRRRTSRC